ncbi:STAS domain-containing protein [Magnetococcus sp. PR-3]|uniref:STAS domain-containing protein n=1 Tax=Magnetococcus sp. PR-3 TaxID=3120355 RepID=UPI002FCE51EB
MDISMKVKGDNSNTVVLTMPSRVKFRVWKEFMGSYEELIGDRKVEFDMQQVVHIDSAGIGMLLWAREQYGQNEMLHITNCQPKLRHLLTIADMQKLFVIT